MLFPVEGTLNHPTFLFIIVWPCSQLFFSESGLGSSLMLTQYTQHTKRGGANFIKCKRLSDMLLVLWDSYITSLHNSTAIAVAIPTL